MTRHAASHAADDWRTKVRLLRVPRDGHGLEPKFTTLTDVMGPGGEGKPVLTILEPGEE